MDIFEKVYNSTHLREENTTAHDAVYDTESKQVLDMIHDISSAAFSVNKFVSDYKAGKITTIKMTPGDLNDIKNIGAFLTNLSGYKDFDTKGGIVDASALNIDILGELYVAAENSRAHSGIERTGGSYADYDDDYCLIVKSEDDADTVKYILDDAGIDYDIEKVNNEIGVHCHCKEGKKDIEYVFEVAEEAGYDMRHQLCTYDCNFGRANMTYYVSFGPETKTEE
jgi:hypothetical protein